MSVKEYLLYLHNKERISYKTIANTTGYNYKYLNDIANGRVTGSNKLLLILQSIYPIKGGKRQ